MPGYGTGLGFRCLPHQRSSFVRQENDEGQACRAIPISAELKPYLEGAAGASPSGLVFPDTGGLMLKPDLPLQSCSDARSDALASCRATGLHARLPEEGLQALRGDDRRQSPTLTDAPVEAIAEGQDPTDPVSRPEEHVRLVAHDGRGNPGIRPAHPAPLRLAHHDGGLRAPLPGYLKDEVDRLSFDVPTIEKHIVAPLAPRLVTGCHGGPIPSSSGRSTPC